MIYIGDTVPRRRTRKRIVDQERVLVVFAVNTNVDDTVPSGRTRKGIMKQESLIGCSIFWYSQKVRLLWNASHAVH